MITFLKGSCKGNTPTFQSRQLVGMDLEIVHAKSNKPLVTIQDQVMLLVVLMLMLVLDKPLVKL